jgi:hypothetical protein
VPELGGDAVPAAEDLAPEHQAPADAGPDGRHHEGARTLAGPEPVLRPGGGVRVVLHHGRQPDPVLDQLAQRLVAPGEVRGEHDPGAVQREEPGRTDADRGDLAALAELGDDLGDALGDGLRVPRRRLAPGRGDEGPLRDHPAGDLGAADVDPDAQAQDSSQSVSSRSIFSTGDAFSDGTCVASTPAAACISELAATARWAFTSGLVVRTAWMTWHTGQYRQSSDPVAMCSLMLCSVSDIAAAAPAADPA